MKAIDLFAGAGGWTEGATQAGVNVLVAVNHWPIAVASHKANHPNTHHLCQDVSLLNATTLPKHDLMLASPACQGRANARGKDRPHHDDSRSTAWAVVDIAEVARPKYLAVENVPEMRTWKLYSVWRNALELLGYKLVENVLNASEFGVPQDRERLIITGVRGGSAITLRSPKLKPVPASSFIDWSAGSRSPVRDHVPNTVARWKRARSEGYGKRFVMPYYGNGSGLTGRSIDRPIGTLTCKDRWALVNGDQMRMLTVGEQKAAMSFRDDYVLSGPRCDQVTQLGNAVCPKMACEVTRQIVGG